MSNLTKKPSPDRSKIDAENPIELKYWLRALSVSKEDLLAAIQKVGNSAVTVRKELVNAGLLKPDDASGAEARDLAPRREAASMIRHHRCPRGV